MTLILAGKGDVEHLKRFKEGDFPVYELYIQLFKESLYQKILSLPSHIKIKSIHNPTRVRIGDKIEEFDLMEEGGIGEESLRALEETIKLAKKIGAKTVVIHGAKYNLSQPKENALRLLAEKIKSLEVKWLNLCFENDALWYNTFYPRRALLASGEDFRELDNFLEGSLKIAADIEHFHLNYYFESFLKKIGEEGYLEKYVNNPAKFEEDFRHFMGKNWEKLVEGFYGHINSFFREFKDKIEHIHLNGSDCFNFCFDPETKLPLVGEHLPLGFNKEGIKDCLDYGKIIELLRGLLDQKEILVVLEVWRKNLEEFISEMRNSKQFLIKYLK